MTADQLRQQVEALKLQKGLTTNEALEYIKGQNISPEELERLRANLRQQMENPFGTWNTFNPSKVFGQ